MERGADHGQAWDVVRSRSEEYDLQPVEVARPAVVVAISVAEAPALIRFVPVRADAPAGVDPSGSVLDGAPRAIIRVLK